MKNQLNFIRIESKITCKNIFTPSTLTEILLPSIAFHDNGISIIFIPANCARYNNSTSWASLYNIYFLPPNYSGTNYLSENTKDTKGEWIYYKLPKQISLFKYTISSVNNRPQTWDTTSNTKLDISL